MATTIRFLLLALITSEISTRPNNSKLKLSSDLKKNNKHCINQPFDRIASEVESDQPINYFNLASSGWQIFLVAAEGCGPENSAPPADADAIIDDLLKSLDLDNEATKNVYSGYLTKIDEKQYFNQVGVHDSNNQKYHNYNYHNSHNSTTINPILEFLNGFRFGLNSYIEEPNQKKSDYLAKLINGTIDRLLETNIDEIVDKVVFNHTCQICEQR